MKRDIYIILLIIVSFQIQGCHDDDIISDPITITSVVTNVSEYGGNNGSINLTVNGGSPPYSFIWSNNEQTEDIFNLTAGIYIVLISDKNDQTFTDTFIVAQPLPGSLILTITKQDVSTYGGNDGAASANVSGGIVPYQYHWSNGSTEKDITGLTAGIYNLTVTDVVLTSITDSILISQPTLDTIIIRYTITDPSETGATDGTIDLTITGGYPPYSFLWSNGSEQEDQSGLGANIYSVTVTDQQEQTAYKTIMLSDVLTDIDENTYLIVRIGEQTWMKENLKVTHNPLGESIVSYAYTDDISNVDTYGRLYTWEVTMDSSTAEKSQGICPCGWHVPSDNEFKVLEVHLGMTLADADLVNTWRGTGIGTSLKAGGSSGYNALLCGRRSSAGQYSLLNLYEYEWTSSEYGNNAWRRCLDLNSDLVGRWNTFPKNYAFSVRCIKDE